MTAPRPLLTTTRPPAAVYTPARALEAYSRGTIGCAEAIQAIGGRGFADLLDALARHDWPLPRGRGQEAEIARQVATCLPLVRAALRPAPPDTPSRP
ncbi:MAG: hypothetical protein OXC91_13505 [Rhodobacteraceae bacterium]|nr:hypothetical protein [Paracoccaceae bacterium]